MLLLLLLLVLSADCWSLLIHFRFFLSGRNLDHVVQDDVVSTFFVSGLLAAISIHARTFRTSQDERSVIYATQDIARGYDLALLLLFNRRLSQIVPILGNLSGSSLAISHLTCQGSDKHKAGRSHICDNNMVALVLLLIFTDHRHCRLRYFRALDFYLCFRLDFLFMNDKILD